MFHRNSALDAKNFFDSPDEDIPRFVHNQFGATLGGPIIRDKLFFFSAYEGTRTRQGQSFVSTVPTEVFRRGDFSEHPNTIFDPLTTRPDPDGEGFIRDPFPNNTVPADRIDPVGRNLVDLYPLPNRPGIVNNFVFNPTREVDGGNSTSRWTIGPPSATISRTGSAWEELTFSIRARSRRLLWARAGSGPPGARISNLPSKRPTPFRRRPSMNSASA
ncbi:MAG: hypothetical protein GEU99_14585 [Luteitalea sp.]|nr:hypothetical protein [Luteitalea sp.]